ncbi:MAG: protease HtpX [Bdellovibrionales bacterium]|nr:protease HtpX [Bdellovibrionales bacterium]
MQIVKRVFFFFLVNLLVVLTISLVVDLLGIQPYLTAQGLNYQSLAVLCLIWGFGGALISLSISRIMAKWMMGVQIIDPHTVNLEQRALVDTVYDLARKAKLTTMPQVGFYQSDEVNAFATGPSRHRSLVAVSTGLLQNMNEAQVRGVLGHEVAHIANGDMVTMTLLQGVINAFVMFFARLAAFAISQSVEGEQRRNMVRFISTIVFEVLLSFLGMFVVAYFSRYREYRADAGGAKFAGRQNMISALQGLQGLQMNSGPQMVLDNTDMNAFKISGRKKGGLLALLSTHPALEDRIASLQKAQIA